MLLVLDYFWSQALMTSVAVANKPTASSHRLAVLCGKQSGRSYGRRYQRALASGRSRDGDVSCFLCGPITAAFLFDREFVGNRRVGTQMRILVAGYVLLAVVQPSIAQSLPETEQPWAPDH